MPLYEFECALGHRTEHWLSVEDRNGKIVFCEHPDHGPNFEPIMKRIPGGHAMLYFEEGRARQTSLSNKPITSYAEHKRLMREQGVSESGNTVPERIKRNPRTEGMKRFLSKDQKGKWI